MKKITGIILCIALLFAFSVNAFAAGEYENMGALYQHWHESHESYESSPYPDYVCGVWMSAEENDGPMHWIIAVTKDEAGENGKEEILSQLEDSSNVEFTYGSYAYSELWEIQLELQQQMGEKTGVFGMGIDETENCISIDYDESNPNSTQFIKDCYEKYGNRIRFVGGDGVALDITSSEIGLTIGGMGADMGGGEKSSSVVWIVAAAILLLVAISVFALYRRSKALSLVPAEGSAAAGTVSRESVTAAVKDSAVTPPDCVYEAIKSEIEKDK